MEPEFWERAGVVAGAIVVTLVVARVVDRAIKRRLRLTPEALTRYGVLRRSLTAAIVALGILSALLVIPAVRAVAGGVLASSAVAALVIGMAARSTLANFVAGVLIAFTQPLRIGDEVEVGGASGTVEDIELTYTTLRSGGVRYFIPNEKLASDTIRNATIAGAEHLAEVSLPVPLASDLEQVLALAENEARAVSDPSGRNPSVSVTDLDTQGQTVVVTVEAWARPGGVAPLQGELRRRLHARLRAEGIF